MEYSQRYFYITRNFVPDYSQEFTHIQDDIYKHNRTGDLYRRRLLCDFGWGHEPGYERLPALSFDELISLIEYDPFPGKLPKLRRFLFSKKEYLFYQNLRGAISVIMADHIEAFVEFLAQKCETPYFENPCIRENYKYFYLDKYYDGKGHEVFNVKVGVSK